MFWKIRDPVCGAKVNRNTEYQIKYGRKTYYFDCRACKSTFEQAPERFAKRKISFLERKVKPAELPKCH